MRASFDHSVLRTAVRLLGVGLLCTHLAAAEDDCTIRILVGEEGEEGEGEGEGEEGEGEGEGEDVDSDGDGLLDRDEQAIGTDPQNPDSDFDGLLDGTEAFCAVDLPVAQDDNSGEERPEDVAVAPGCCTDPLNPDSDFDGLLDGEDSCDINGSDSDWDGLDDELEYAIGTDPYNYDSDFDGLGDGEEFNCGWGGTEPAQEDEAGLVAPIGYCTDPLNYDSDFDGLSDGDEVWYYGTDPTNPDTDGDGILDGEEENTNNGDSDFDGVDDQTELAIGTDPYNPDSDFDGLLDGTEIFCGNVWVDGEERPEGDPTDPDQPEPAPVPEECTDPLNPDTDGDGILDGEEGQTEEVPPCDDATGQDCG
jgi:hypothetical protein